MKDSKTTDNKEITIEADANDKELCPVCKGKGFVINDDGTATWCTCMQQDNTERRLVAARIPAKYMTRTFESFTPYSPQLKKIYQDALRYATTFQSIRKIDKKGLLLTGSVGTGKTHLAAAILRKVISDGHSGLFWNIVDFFRELRSTMNNDDPEHTEESILAKARQVDLLVLDDLGIEKTTDWVLDRLYLLINSRYQDDMPLIVTTNQTLPELADRVGQRIVSRLSEMCSHLNINAEDYRRKNMK